MELTLEGMLEELESRCQEALKRIERREAEVRDALMLLAAHAREGGGPAPFAPEASARASAPAPVREKTARDARQEKTEAILRLANDGLDVVAIAQRLGLGKGEVQLVLDLHKQRGER